jgi:cell division protein FtsZ
MAGIVYDDQNNGQGANITVVGAGGGGGNAVDNMVRKGVQGVRFIAANTDVQALDRSMAHHTVALGTKGLGAGADPEKGKEAAMAACSELMQHIQGSDMVFVTAGEGGGTGTGAAPVIAKAARDSGALTVGVVTKPFTFEGIPRMRNAEKGIEELGRHVDALVVIPNDRLLEMSDEPIGLEDSFAMADDVLMNAVKAISDIILVPGLINVDFADVEKIMKGRGKAIMGIGEASGSDRALVAAQTAMTSKLLEEQDIKGATGILVNIVGGKDVKLQEVTKAMQLIQSQADKNAEIIMGCVLDKAMTEKIRITIIATGFDMVTDTTRPLVTAAVQPAPGESAQDPMKTGMHPKRNILGNGPEMPPPIRQPMQAVRHDHSRDRMVPEVGANRPPMSTTAPQTVSSPANQPVVKAVRAPGSDPMSFNPFKSEDWF